MKIPINPSVYWIIVRVLNVAYLIRHVKIDQHVNYHRSISRSFVTKSGNSPKRVCLKDFSVLCYANLMVEMMGF